MSEKLNRSRITRTYAAKCSITKSQTLL